MAAPTKRKAQSAGHKAEGDDLQSRQPAWRQPPAKPRKRAKPRVYAAQQSDSGTARNRAPARVFTRPTRETVLGWLRMAGLALAVAAVAAGLVSLLRWPLLMVDHRSTLIGGAQRINPTDIYQKSEIGGRSILVLNAADIEARLRQMPGVAKVDAHLRLPNQVIIDVVEHAPLVAWQTVSETLWLSADGSPVPQAGIEPPLRLVDQSGGRLMRDPALKALTLRNLAALQEADGDIREVYYGNSEGLYYRSAQGWDVWLGESGGIAEKLTLVATANREIARAGAQPKVVDVRHSNRKAMWW